MLKPIAGTPHAFLPHFPVAADTAIRSAVYMKRRAAAARGPAGRFFSKGAPPLDSKLASRTSFVQ